MKAYKKITVAAIMLFIAVLVLASFFGVYVLKVFRVKNIIPDYSLGMDFSEKRVITFEVSEEEAEENLTAENYKKVKSIFENKLDLLDTAEYVVRLDEGTGKIIVEIPENDNADNIVESLTNDGTFSIVDYETNDNLLDQNNLSSSSVRYASTTDGTSVYLLLQFDEDGAKKLEEISSTYIGAPETEDEEETENDVVVEEDPESEEDEGKYVSMLVGGETYIAQTAFGETYSDGMLYLTFGTANDTETLNTYINNASLIKSNLDAGVIPVEYTETTENTDSIVDMNVLTIGLYVVAGLYLIGFVYLIIKYKKAGVQGIILQLGYIAALLLIVRVLGVKIALSGIIGFIISAVLNFIFTCMIFNNVFVERKEINVALKESFSKFAIKTIVIDIIALVFAFATLLNINSVGVALVWGIILTYVYNVSLTNILLKVSVKEELDNEKK